MPVSTCTDLHLSASTVWQITGVPVLMKDANCVSHTIVAVPFSRALKAVLLGSWNDTVCVLDSLPLCDSH